MAPERWEKIKQVLGECLERPPEERPAYLDDACAGDLELRREVESLSASYEAAGDMMEEPALGREDSPADMEGRRVGPYRIVREIGEGGMARVYLAVRADDAFRRQVAIKLVKRGMDFEFILRRFRHERQIMASLEHPNIARLLDGGHMRRRRAVLRDGVHPGPPDRRALRRQPADRPGAPGVVPHGLLGGRSTRTSTASSTATSSRATSSSRRRACPSCSISASPRSWTRTDWTGTASTRTATVLRLMTPGVRQPRAGARRAR